MLLSLRKNGLTSPFKEVRVFKVFRKHPNPYNRYEGPKYVTETKHINFFNINILAPTQNPSFGAPEKKFMCLISWERTQKRDQHKLFRGIFGVKNGVPIGPFSATKSLVYGLFLPLTVM